MKHSTVHKGSLPQPRGLQACPGLRRGTSVRLPEIPDPFAVEPHPDWLEITRACNEWTVHRLCRGDTALATDLIGAGTGPYVCESIPKGLPERLLDLCKLSVWWFGLDDEFTRIRWDLSTGERERTTRLHARVEEIWALATGARKDDDLWPGDVVREIFHTMIGRVAPSRASWLIDVLGSWQQRGAKLDLDQTAHRDDSIEAFIPNRAVDSACPTFARLIEYTLGIEVTEHERTAEPVRRFLVTIYELWFLLNDLFSFRAECFADQHDSTICFLRRVYGISLQEAVDWTASRMIAAQQQSVEILDEISRSDLGTSDDLMLLLRTYQHTASGTYHQSLSAQRYHGRGFRWNGARSGTIVLHPDLTEFPPPPKAQRLYPATSQERYDALS
ncbi:terpene synthase family protein [Streptomyces alanosinicus]|uniref:Terpene synthase n=1 Tax=Streptomyces alanosinicus TaxID=68171 RepID=A0A918YQ92_9ACTN|nr:terpene synthase family protein [Streptomyces alanosinicus]GHE11007.1 hypothetical protein GCM10010339_69090 [Streptomyces alanosinicus]